MSTIRLQAKVNKKGITTVKVLIKHPMENGSSKDLKTGKIIPAEFIEDLICKHKDKIVMSANWGSGISKNPYFSFKFTGGAEKDKVKLTWKDNQAKTDSREVEIKKSRK